MILITSRRASWHACRHSDDTEIKKVKSRHYTNLGGSCFADCVLALAGNLPLPSPPDRCLFRFLREITINRTTWGRSIEGLVMAWFWADSGLCLAWSGSALALFWLGYGLALAWPWFGLGLGLALFWLGSGMVVGLVLAWSWLGSVLVLAWFLVSSGLVLAWFWHRSGLFLAWAWHVSGLVFGWFWLVPGLALAVMTPKLKKVKSRHYTNLGGSYFADCVLALAGNLPLPSHPDRCLFRFLREITINRTTWGRSIEGLSRSESAITRQQRANP